MRKLMLLVWVLLPVLVGAYHYGPGQTRVKLDEAADLIAKAKQHVQQEELTEAEDCYQEVLRLLPEDKTGERQRIRLEICKIQMLNNKLPEAHGALGSLLAEIEGDKNADSALLRDTRKAMASARYYLTWLMRLEGRTKEEWEPEIEAARQIYTLLAEQSLTAGNDNILTEDKKDLEAAIRLARMDLAELQGLPLPSQ